MIPALSVPEPFQLIVLDRVDSTNEEIKRLAGSGAVEGTLVWAHEQAAGRGRRGRIWVSPRGNLYCSILLRPNCPTPEAMQVGFVTALATADAVEIGLPEDATVTYKWPNDILVDGRKVAGILLESAAGNAGTLEWLAVGVGVNIASYPPHTESRYPATSLSAVGAVGMTPAKVLQTYCERFNHWFAAWERHGFAVVREAWLERAHGLGQPIEVRLDQATLEGTFLTMNESGALVLVQGDVQRLIMAGDVFPASS